MSRCAGVWEESTENLPDFRKLSPSHIQDECGVILKRMIVAPSHAVLLYRVARVHAFQDDLGEKRADA